MNIRPYTSSDYKAVKELYLDSSTYGGQFDEARDTQERLNSLIQSKPNSILVAEVDGVIKGTVTIFEDGRECWLYRFAVDDEDKEIIEALHSEATKVCKEMGHTQVLVYAPAGNKKFEERYTGIGFNKGNDYTAYWMEI